LLALLPLDFYELLLLPRYASARYHFCSLVIDLLNKDL
jgi:hypothetical protein